MNIVSDSTSIHSLVVSSKDLEFIPFPNNKFLDNGKQISGIIGRPITDFTRRMTSGGVEISKGDKLAIGPYFSEGFDHHFHTEFGLAIWTNGFAFKFLRTIILFAIDGGGGGEKEVFALFELLHRFEEIQ